MTPRRLQLSRARGWRMPAGAVKVDRSTKWGNPHAAPVGVALSRAARQKLVDAFERDLRAGALPVTVDDVRRELAGKQLACWCQLEGPCHAAVLLEIANSGETS